MASKKTETALATKESVALAAFPVFAEDQREDAMEAISTNLGSGIKITDLTKVTVPLGGGLAFNVMTPEGPSSEQTLTGIMLLAQDGKALFLKSMEEAPNSPPACYSNDAVTGIGDPFETGQVSEHNCAVCPFNVFGSATRGSGKGKACKDTKPIYLLEPGCVLPTIVQVPPTSLKHVNKFMGTLCKGGVVYYGVVVEIGLAQEQNPPPVHSVLTFKSVSVIPKAERLAVKEFRTIFEQFARAAVPSQETTAEPTPGNADPNAEDYDPFAEEAAAAAAADAAPHPAEY